MYKKETDSIRVGSLERLKGKVKNTCLGSEEERERERGGGWESIMVVDAAFIFSEFACCDWVNTSGIRNTEQDMDIPTSLY